MSAQLPYLPPLDRYKKDIQSIATGTAEDVRASQGAAATAGNLARGVIAAGGATVKAANDVAAAPYKAVGSGIADFTRNLFGGPTLGLPALAAPGAAGPAAATQQPVVATAPAAAAAAAAPAPAKTEAEAAAEPTAALPVLRRAPLVRIDHGNGYYSLTNNPVDIGAASQAAYAEQQRQAVLAAAAAAAASGDPGNASLRYAAALGALPHLSGSNNFAATQAQLDASRADTAEHERANIRTNETGLAKIESDNENIRRNAQPTVIGEEINPDTTTRMFAPTIKKYGFVSRTKDGKIEVRDMQGTVQKPPEQVKPTVGAKVKQKDGTFPLEGGRTAVVKGGVITEIK